MAEITEVEKKTGPKGAEPLVIARLIQKAIEVRKPKTRYWGGYLAGPLLFLRKLLSDRMMDRLWMSQLK